MDNLFLPTFLLSLLLANHKANEARAWTAQLGIAPKILSTPGLQNGVEIPVVGGCPWPFNMELGSPPVWHGPSRSKASRSTDGRLIRRPAQGKRFTWPMGTPLPNKGLIPHSNLGHLVLILLNYIRPKWEKVRLDFTLLFWPARS